MQRNSDTVWAIGDVHGRADLLRELQKTIKASAEAAGASRPKVVYLGDYIDRGPDSRGVIDLLLNGLPGFQKIFLSGNHEAMLRRFLLEPDHDSASHWYRNGGNTALESYGIGPETVSSIGGDPVALRDCLLAKMPGSHRDFFLNGLSLLHEDSRAIFVHAGLRPGVALAQQSDEDLLWIRDPFLRSSQNWGRPVVHGHTPNPYGPEFRGGRINLDTMAFGTGALTGLELGNEGPRFLVSSERKSYALVVDPEGEGSPEWIDWSLMRAVSSGASTVGLCLPRQEGVLARQKLADQGVATKFVALPSLLEAWADPASPFNAARASKSLLVQLPGVTTENLLKAEVRSLQSRAAFART